MGKEFKMLQHSGTGKVFFYTESLERRGDMQVVMMTHEQILGAAETGAEKIIAPVDAIAESFVAKDFVAGEIVVSAPAPAKVVPPRPIQRSRSATKKKPVVMKPKAVVKSAPVVDPDSFIK